MTDSTATIETPTVRSIPFLPLGILAGFVVAALAVVLIAFFTYLSLVSRQTAAVRTTAALNSLQQLEAVISTLKDAETGQRGFLLTGDERYLAPYTQARADLTGELNALQRANSGSPDQLRRLEGLQQASMDKMAELGETIELQRAGKADQARLVVLTDRGKAAMDRVRELAGEMEAEERTLAAARQAEWDTAVRVSSWITWGGSVLLLALIGWAGVLTSNDYRRRETEAWLRASHAAFAIRIQGERRIEVLGERVLEFLAATLNAQVGAAYVRDPDGALYRVASYALSPVDALAVIRGGDNLLGQAAKENRTLHVTAVPEEYLPVVSAVGRRTPAELVIAPSSADGVVYAVLELGFFKRVLPAELELFARISGSLAVAVRSARDRTRLEELLAETQQQAEELQTQQEELRVNNEELEEQSRLLKESQARLETQQAELEQTNTQLEEQAHLLEEQRDELELSRGVLAERAAELARSNQYKSEFLANMSHELRTPLNSSLILAKLLADNKGGNLTDEQVKFAQTISSAGNDLLALINDILDLSKIEAGKVDVLAAPVSVAATLESLVRTFRPLAQEKGIELSTILPDGIPDHLVTDAHRLGQILKNLVSNALKFTERGAVTIHASAPGANQVSFAVSDTGIGIPSHQLGAIFEAFRQADGSTHRRYGGTGLGLSISRDLARLLGGEISVASAPGHGSTFTLLLPLIYAGPARLAEAPASVDRAPVERRIPAPPLQPPAPKDQVPDAARGRHEHPSRRILVIEDDVRFAMILRDLAHEMNFECLVAGTANEGLAAAVSFAPDAIILDINLPDHSGLGVLDQLKHTPSTRHIPVHVVSVTDYSHEALERGAVGYAMKPVKREELIDAFRRLEAKFSQSLRRVLVVDDDEAQRESIRQLLTNSDVQITAVGSAKEALDQLRATTFDCVVMDINLPDVSGDELLDTMAGQGDVSFPPVIVYTGRSLSRDEEHRLRRFSSSIIIKDVRSPERLLDEVTLFLHQVESALPVERQRMLQAARDRDAALDGRRILVVEDDARNIFALSSILEPKGARLEIARNGREALAALDRSLANGAGPIDLVLMDIMMPEMDGLTAMREIRRRPHWKKLPIIALTAKAMKDDQERCLAAGASDYIAKPLDVEKLLSLVRVWMPK